AGGGAAVRLGHDRRSQGRDADASESALRRVAVERVAYARARRPHLRRSPDVARLRPGVGVPWDALRGRVRAPRAMVYAVGAPAHASEGPDHDSPGRPGDVR